jgi:DNA-directed RNA polymerase specialized sigma24 family protein
MSTLWPTIDDGYIDPEGYIDPAVYKAAGDLWYMAGGYAMVMLNDEAAGRQIMLKAAASVTAIRASENKPIRNLKYYLYKAYKRLVWQERKRLKPRDDEWLDTFVAMYGGDTSPEDDPAKLIEKGILVERAISLMDDWTREVYKYLVLGHSFEDIARAKGKESNIIRSKYHKKLKQIGRIMGCGTATTKSGTSSDLPLP